MSPTRNAAPPAPATHKAKGRYEKLSPGPGRQADEVGAHQRARFHAAMIELVAERGYAGVAIHDLAAVAKVSSRAFYEQFGGKEDCFLRTHEMVVRRAAKRVIAAQAGERDWNVRLHLAFGAFFRELEREPEAARLALVEAYRDGPAAHARARKAELLFGAMLADSFSRAPGGPAVSPLAVEAIVAGAAEVARRFVLSGKRRASPRLVDELLEWVLACRERAAEPWPASLPSSSSEPAAAGSRSGSSDRDLCLAAAAKLALGDGYASLTVARLCAAAGISRRRFEAEFAGVDDCLAAARDERLEPVFVAAERTRRSADDEAGTAAAVQVLCAHLEQDRDIARLCFAIDRVGPLCASGGDRSGGRVADRVARALYGAKAANRRSTAAQAGAGMVWTTIGAHALDSHRHPLERVSALLAALA